MIIKRHIPNIITLSNLFCGILAIEQAFLHHFFWAGTFILLGATFDFFDGFSARLLGVSNIIGKELDSLADMVTFGVAPGVITYSFLRELTSETSLLPYFAFLIPLLSAVRLARFNVDENQSDKFIGLPTPANSIFFLSLPLIYKEYVDTTTSTNLIITCVLLLTLVFGLLLNARIELLALKFKTFKWSDNTFRFSFVIITVLLLISLTILGYFYVAIPTIIIIYLLISVINNLKNNTKL